MNFSTDKNIFSCCLQKLLITSELRTQRILQTKQKEIVERIVTRFRIVSQNLYSIEIQSQDFCTHDELLKYGIRNIGKRSRSSYQGKKNPNKYENNK